MDFEEIVKKRQDTRRYLTKEVSEDLIDKILELANLAPSAGNLQARKVIIVSDVETRKKLQESCHGFARFSGNLPIIFVICSVPEESAVRYEERGRKLYALQDATIFASYVQLAAVSLGLSTCWVGSFKEKVVSDVLNLPSDFIPVVMIPVGYSEDKLKERKRKPLHEIILKKI